MTERTDSDLLGDYVKRNSESAFGELVSRHIALVYSAAVRVVVDPNLAEDVTQTTFAILAREARHLARRALLASWLHRTASNQAAKLVRGEMRRRAREQEAYAMQTESSEPHPDWNLIAPMLDAALNELSESDRTVIFLRFFEKKTAKEIGWLLELKEETAQKRVTRALDRLRALLTGQGAASSSATLASLITTHGLIAAPVGLTTSVSAAALTSGLAVKGITLNTLKLIMMSKIKISALSALIIAGIATPLVIQHQTVTKLRRENSALQMQGIIIQGKYDELSAQLSDARKDQSLTKGQLSDLLRLRGETEPIRKDIQDLARLRAAQEQAESALIRPAGDFLPAGAWTNAGTARPEAAIQTFFWAGKQGDTNLVGNLLRWRRDPAIPDSDELDLKFAQGIVSGTTRFAGSLEGLRVTSQQEEGNEVRLCVELTNQEGGMERVLRLVHEDNQWFPIMHVWLDGQGSIRAAMTVPPKFEQAR